MNLPGPPSQSPNAVLTKRRRWGLPIILATLVVATLGLAGYVATGPYRTLNGLQAAVTQGDANALSQYVDFTTLRQNLKDQLNARANTHVNSVLQNGLLSRIAGGLATSVVDTTVNSLVTPAGLNRLLLGASLISSQTPTPSGESLQKRLENGRCSFESLSTFTVAFSAVSGSELVLVLTRSGFTWQLTNVRIPVRIRI